MLSNVQVQLQLRKDFEHFNTSKHRAFKQWRCTLCFLAALWTTLDHTLFRRIIKPLRFYGLKGRLTLVLDINYVIWNVLPFTDAITFPNSQTGISIFEVVEATKMLNLIYTESVLWFANEVLYSCLLQRRARCSNCLGHERCIDATPSEGNNNCNEHSRRIKEHSG